MFYKINQFLKDYFAFNRTERKGVWLLFVLLIVALAIPFILDFLPNKLTEVDMQDTKRVQDLQTSLKIKEKEAKFHSFDSFHDNSSKEHYAFDATKPAHYFSFDPNTASESQLEELGIPKWLVKRVLNYRSKGGKFYKKEDLQRIYSFPPALYASLSSYITLPEKSAGFTPFAKTAEPNVDKSVIKESYKPVSFDLNRADTNDLKKIKGVGSKLAFRIINYRDKIGGFYDETQLREVYGLDSLVVQETLKYGFVKNPVLRKIKINEITAEDFKHFYLKFYVVKAIVAYRQQHGKFSSRKDLENIKVLDAKSLDKIAPYLEF